MDTENHAAGAETATGDNLDPLRKLLTETTLDYLKHMQHVTILKDTATVEQALKTLASRRILSAPVISAAGESHQPLGAHWPQEQALQGNNSILGFIDIRDILSSFLRELEGSDLENMKMLQRLRVLEDKGQSFSTSAIKDLKVFGGDGDFFHTSQSKASLKEVIMYGLLNPKERGMHGGRHINDIVHRVAVYDSDFKITNIISQTDIVRFLYLNRQLLCALGERTVEQLGWSSKHVVSVAPDLSAIEAMSLMNDKQISAVAVVDGMNKIIGNFSISEMRTIMAEHFGALALPVGEFLALEHGTEFVGYTRIQEDEVIHTAGHKFVTDRVARTRPRTPGEEVGQSLVLAHKDMTFKDVTERIVSHRIHRVYVIDEQEKPCGVVTCTDVLRAVLDAIQ
eukprot:jgi/Chrzof1/5816/Cz16g16260.t1